MFCFVGVNVVCHQRFWQLINDFRFRKILAEPWADTTPDASPSVADTPLQVTVLSPHCDSHMAKTFTTGATVICL